MIVLLGGFVGSSRRALAPLVARELGFHYYDLSDKKMRRHRFTRDGALHRDAIPPRTDEARRALYEKATRDFPLLAKMYPDTLIDDIFHRKESREYLFKEAGKYFGKSCFVWIESSEEVVEERIQHMEAKGRVRSANVALQRREKMKKNFEPFVPPPLTFTCTSFTDLTSDARALAALIRVQLKL